VVTPLDVGRRSHRRLIVWGLMASLLVAASICIRRSFEPTWISGFTMSCSGLRTAFRRRDGS
jgi:hypothetical protein